MLVKDCMTRHPIMVPPTMPAAEAQQLMNQNGIRHLPVISNGKRLLGLLTKNSFVLDTDQLGSLDVWEITRHLSRKTAADLMTPAGQVLTTSPDRTIERTARQLIDNRASCQVVLDEDGVVAGILTEIDLLNAFQIMLGLSAPGVRVTIRMPDQPGEFAKLSAVLGEQGWGIMAIGTYPTPRRDGYYDTVIKIVGEPTERVKEVLSMIPGQELIEIRETV